MTDRCETFRDCRTTIPLLSLKVSNCYTIACSFYGSPNEQNRMYELCTFSQIRSHIRGRGEYPTSIVWPNALRKVMT